MEIGVIQNIEELRSKLELFGLGERNILGSGKIPICVVWSDPDIASRSAKLLNRRVWIRRDSCKGVRV